MKRFWPTFSRIIVHDKLPETTYKGPQGKVTINVELKGSFLQDPRVCWKQNFLKKKAIFPVKKRFSPLSPRVIEHEKRPETFYKGPQGNLTINVEVIRPFLLDPRGFWKHKTLKNKAIFPVKKRFSAFSSRIIDQNKRPKTTYKVPQRNLTINVEVIRPFLLDPRGCWKHKILKKKANFPVKKRFSPISSRIIEDDKRQRTTYKRPQGKVTINVEVKRSFLQDPRCCWKHKFLKKNAIFPVKKRFSPISSRIIEHDKRQRTTQKGPQGNLTINVEVIRPFLLDPRSCWKQKILKKKADFPVKKRFSPISSRIIEHEERHRTTYKVPQGNLTINVEVIRPFLKDPRGFWKQKILKNKAIFSVKKRFSPISSRIMEYDKRPETTYKGRQGNLTFNVEVIRKFLHDPRGCWKHNFLKKKAIFPVKKDFRLFLLVIQNLTNNMEQLIRVDKVTWQLMLKLKYHFFRNQEVAENINFWRKRQPFPCRNDFRLFLLVL